MKLNPHITKNPGVKRRSPDEDIQPSYTLRAVRLLSFQHDCGIHTRRAPGGHDARQSSDRPRLFELAAEKCYTDTRGQYAISRALAYLPSVQRLDAARAVVALPEVSEQLVVMMVDATDSLRSSDREEFLSLVLESPQGSSDAVREACTDAARRHLSSRARERILQRLARQR